MTQGQRNAIFEEYMNIIRYTANRHQSMLKALRMETEDLTQELAIYLLKAIEKYQPDRGAKPSTYYFKSLRYGVLNLWREQMRAIRVANLQAMSLSQPRNYGDYGNGENESTIDVPFVVDYDDRLMVEEFLQTLSECERTTIARLHRQ